MHMDSEILNTGLSAISVKGYDAGDPKEYIGLRARNSFRSVHRPDLSKLKNWSGNHARQKLGNFGNDPGCSTLPINDDSGTELVEGNQLTLIHATVDETADMDDDDSTYISEPRTTQFSDNDLDENTNLHKCRAEFCVTIGRIDRNLRDGITGRIENIGMTPVQEELNEKSTTGL
ncbi:uncharacterized protein LOC107262879 isoform X2 [Cephus cinctus]|nr:uncharacterized protein LOC107262879 isoform X2 [Cephus cinctus]